MTTKPRVLVLARHFNQNVHPVEAKLREHGVSVGVLDVDGLMRGRGKISCLQENDKQVMYFTDARTGQAMTDEEVVGVWLEDLNFVQVPMEKIIDSQDGRAYIDHIGQCEAWMTIMASVGAVSHNRVCLPNPEFSYLDVPELGIEKLLFIQIKKLYN